MEGQQGDGTLDVVAVVGSIQCAALSSDYHAVLHAACCLPASLLDSWLNCTH